MEEAVRVLLAPLARLAVSSGLSYPATADLLKQAFVDAAKQSLIEAGVNGTRMVSRISTSTGIHRREVTRLTSTSTAAPKLTNSLASQLFAQWMSDPALHDTQGMPLALPRQGPAPSFEALAKSVTQDVHPRSMLDELCRLGMATLDEEKDTVHLVKQAFVPAADKAHMLAFLGDNVGDHFQGAVHNVLTSASRQHFDQAVFCEGLSNASLDIVRQFVTSQWKRILAEAVPLLEQRIEGDKQDAKEQEATRLNRVRIGLYTYDGPMSEHREQGDTPS